MVSQFIVSDLEKFAISLGRERVKSLFDSPSPSVCKLCKLYVMWTDKPLGKPIKNDGVSPANWISNHSVVVSIKRDVPCI